MIDSLHKNWHFLLLEDLESSPNQSDVGRNLLVLPVLMWYDTFAFDREDKLAWEPFENEHKDNIDQSRLDVNMWMWQISMCLLDIKIYSRVLIRYVNIHTISTRFLLNCVWFSSRKKGTSWDLAVVSTRFLPTPHKNYSIWEWSCQPPYWLSLLMVLIDYESLWEIFFGGLTKSYGRGIIERLRSQDFIRILEDFGGF